MQPIVAVPSFICADAFHKFLPFATGFAAGCMIWIVVAEVLPDAFKVICLMPLLIVERTSMRDLCGALHHLKEKREKRRKKRAKMRTLKQKMHFSDPCF